MRYRTRENMQRDGHKYQTTMEGCKRGLERWFFDLKQLGGSVERENSPMLVRNRRQSQKRVRSLTYFTKRGPISKEKFTRAQVCEDQ